MIKKGLWALVLIATLALASCTSFFQKPQKTKPVVVYVDMVADLFHPGHVAFLKKAKAQGDYLIVGLMSDEDAASYKRTPIMTLKERSEMVQSCRYVDEVIEAAPLCVTNELIDEHLVNLVVHGDDFNPESANYFYKAAIERGIFKTVPYTAGVSTSDIIERILERGSSNLSKKMLTENERLDEKREAQKNSLQTQISLQ
jgi:cytidyltransferase-like protein